MIDIIFCRTAMAKACLQVVFVFICVGHGLAFNVHSLPLAKMGSRTGGPAVGGPPSLQRWSCGLDRAFSVESGKEARQWPSIDLLGVLGMGQKGGKQEDIRAGLKARLKSAVELRQGGESRRLVESYLVREPLHYLTTNPGHLLASPAPSEDILAWMPALLGYTHITHPIVMWTKGKGQGEEEPSRFGWSGIKMLALRKRRASQASQSMRPISLASTARYPRVHHRDSTGRMVHRAADERRAHSAPHTPYIHLLGGARGDVWHEKGVCGGNLATGLELSNIGL